MLVNLKIKNIALISEANVDFKKGFTVITGETGAGKSLLIDSLNFVLGQRADKTLIKHGQPYARVDAVFEVDVFHEKIQEFFHILGIEAEDTVRISRSMSLEGKNECRINGEQVTVGMLKTLTSELVDIYGQHDNQYLLDTKNHLFLLDQFDEEQLQTAKQQLRDQLAQLKDIQEQIKTLGGLDEDREKNLELLAFNIEEIESANLVIGQEEELENERNKMRNSEKMYEALRNVYEQLNQGNSLENVIKSMVYQVQSVEQYDTTLQQMKETLENIRYEFMDWQEEFLDYYQKLDYSEDTLNDIEERLEVIKDLKRKYGLSVEGILEYLQTLRQKREMLLHSEEKLQECLVHKKQILQNIYQSCCQLTKVRQLIAQVVEQAIMMELKDLGMYNAQFKVNFDNQYTIDTIEKEVTSTGADHIEFLFSANLGEPLKPLSKIISGGEMSRFMLAIKCVLNAQDYMKTLIFDEIDAGIGGKVGGMVGEKLYKLSLKNQVLCITHLSSIACFADKHMKIEKSSDDHNTYTNLIVLNEEEKIKEIMRMNGSFDQSNYGYLHAVEMVKDANKIKENLKFTK